MRETNDQRMFRGPLADEPIVAGQSRGQVIARLLDAHNHEYYKALGQTIPRPRRGLGRRFGDLVTPLARASAVLLLLCSQAFAQERLPWTGKPNTAAESAAILANAPAWSNVSPAVAPLPEGVIGEPLPSLGIIYWRGMFWTYQIGYRPAWAGNGHRYSRGRRR